MIFKYELEFVLTAVRFFQAVMLMMLILSLFWRTYFRSLSLKMYSKGMVLVLSPWPMPWSLDLCEDKVQHNFAVMYIIQGCW